MGRDRRTRGHRGQRGEALIESLIAIVVLAMVAIAAYTGLTTATRATVDLRTGARGETLLRSAAERLQDPEFAYLPRAGCAGRPTYVFPTVIATEPGYVIRIASVTFWTGAANVPSATTGAEFQPTCPATDGADPGLQQIVIGLYGPSGLADSITVTKRRR